MRKALQFILEHKRSFTLFVALSLSVFLMFMGEGSKTHLSRTVTTAIFNTGRLSFSWGIYMLELWRENKSLRLQNLRLSEQISHHDMAVEENERLRSLLGFREQRELTGSVIPSMVIGHDFDRIVNTLILNVGSRDGVKKNMAVVTAEGLVGMIYDVYWSSCSVLVIKDINARVSAVAEGIRGIIRWEGGPYLRMFGLPLSNIPRTGSKVYTTGLGGVYPKGIFIGTVASPKFEEVEQYASVNVNPAVDFSGVQEVFIMKGSELSDIWDDGTGHFTRPDIQ
jgi:rod shape-determining protein MreC